MDTRLVGSQGSTETYPSTTRELRQFGQCSDVVLNKIGSENIVKYETLKNIILRMAHESGLTQSDKCPHEWNKWPGDFGLPSIRKLEDGTKATRRGSTSRERNLLALPTLDMYLPLSNI